MASYKDYINGAIRITKENISKAVSTLSAVANKRLRRMEERGWFYVYGKDSERSESIAGERKFGAAGKSEQELQSEYKRLTSFFRRGMSSITEIKEQAKEFSMREEELADIVSQYVKETEHDITDVGQYVRYKVHNAPIRDEESPFGEQEFRTEKEWKNFEQAVKAEKSRAKKRGEDFIVPLDKREWYDKWLSGLQLYNHLVETKQYIPSRLDSHQVRELCEMAVVDPRLKSRQEQIDWVLGRISGEDTIENVEDDEDVETNDTSTFFGPNL